jgi:hypothetical protein
MDTVTNLDHCADKAFFDLYDGPEDQKFFHLYWFLKGYNCARMLALEGVPIPEAVIPEEWITVRRKQRD